jgi:hypothetical protein
MVAPTAATAKIELAAADGTKARMNLELSDEENVRIIVELSLIAMRCPVA